LPRFNRRLSTSPLKEEVMKMRFAQLLPVALAMAGVAFTLGVTGVAQAQSAYPTKPVTIVVPFPPGGGVDLAARVIGEKLAARSGQPFVVENRPGVGGLAGAGIVARSAADGHTLLIAPNTIAISPHILAKGAGGGIDVLTDLVPIIMPAYVPMVLVVHPELGARTPAELIALAKRNPGLPYASAGNGSPMHFAGEMFKKATGVNLLHVPYKGMQASITDTLGGQVKVLFASLGSALIPLIRAGKLLPIAVTEARRTQFLPDLPTLTELGIPGVEVDAWYGVLAPKGISPALVTHLNREINIVLEMTDVRDRLNGGGIELRGGTVEAFRTTMREDYARYGRIAREIGLKAD
jgi:tripartite-type tricarboxylate transporter receptor subunit TctC